MKEVYSILEGYDKIYCYPNSNVLKNKLDIRESALLKSVERRLVALRMDELISHPIKGNFDFDHLKKIHKHLFQDIYEWAGITRNCPLAKDSMFCLPQFIDSYAEEIFSKLKEEGYYLNYDYDKTIVSLVNLFSNINALHAFREGNGRTQREFIEQLSKYNGIDLDLTSISQKDMVAACFDSMNGDYTALANLFFVNAKPISEKKINKL